MPVSVSPLISRYAARHGVADAVRDDGRAIVVIDDKYRIRLAPARDGWVALSARLCPLPPARSPRSKSPRLRPRNAPRVSRCFCCCSSR